MSATTQQIPPVGQQPNKNLQQATLYVGDLHEYVFLLLFYLRKIH